MKIEKLRRKRNTAASISQVLSGDDAGSVRIQLTLKPEWARMIDELRKSTRSDTYSDVFRDSVRFYHRVHGLVARGGKVILQEQDGTQYIVLLD